MRVENGNSKNSKEPTVEKNEDRPDAAPNIRSCIFATKIQNNLAPIKIEDNVRM